MKGYGQRRISSSSDDLLTIHSRHATTYMPTYDYKCDACEHSFELFQSITEPVKRKCPQCGRSKLRRLFGTGAAIVFKGSGFYQTDYRSESYKKAAEKEKKPSEGGGGEKKSESKSNTADAAKKAAASED
jgi:putative FmdB family regulatory protein